uniref:Uncharacterized protein n=1 Tax=Quercus lobata TaxID=97700 RepID=A0A7N2LPL3_QUELO
MEQKGFAFCHGHRFLHRDSQLGLAAANRQTQHTCQACRKDISDDKFSFTSELTRASRSRMPEENISTNQVDKYEPIRKSKQISKRRMLDEDDDDEIKYLEKLKTPKATVDYGVEYEDDEEGGSRKQWKISRVLKSSVDGSRAGSRPRQAPNYVGPPLDGRYDVNVKDHLLSRSGKDGKKSLSGRVFEDIDYVEDEDPISDGEINTNKKKPKKESLDLLGDNKKEMTVTTRQQALQTGKDVSSSFVASLIEFPSGLPPAPPMKQKEKISEVEQQLKRVEALQRR